MSFWNDVWMNDDDSSFEKVLVKPSGRLVDCAVNELINDRGNGNLYS